MATLEVEIRAALIADAGVSALVPAISIHQTIAPANSAMPFIVLHRPSSAPDEESYTFSGPGLYRSNITISTFHVDGKQSQAIADAIDALLNDFRGALTATLRIQKARKTDKRDVGFSDISPGYRWDLDFEFIHR